MDDRDFQVLHQARELIRRERFAEAEAILLELREKNREDPYVDGALADLCIKQRRFGEAQELIARHLARRPDDRFFIQRRGDLLGSQNHLKEAEEIFADLFQRSGDPHHGWRLARLQYRLKKYAEAEACFERIVASLHDKAELFFLGFQIKRALGETEAALELIQRAVHLAANPEFFESQKMELLAETKGVSADQWERTLKYSDRRDDPLVLERLAEKYIAEEKFDRAADLYTRLLKLAPSDYGKSRLAYAYYKQLRYDLALALFLELPLKFYLAASFMVMVVKSAQVTGQQEAVIARLKGFLAQEPSAASLWGAVRKLSSAHPAKAHPSKGETRGRKREKPC